MRRLILAFAIALSAAPAASAATIANMDFANGLSVVAQENDHGQHGRLPDQRRRAARRLRRALDRDARHR
jgi:hypothetical protein